MTLQIPRHLVSLGLLTAAPALGFSGAVVSCPRVATPVLLGPVDRVGGHRSTPSAAPTIDNESSDFVFVSVAYARAHGNRATDIQARNSNAVLQATQGKPTSDVRLTSLRASGNGLFVLGMYWSENSIAWKGVKEEVGK
jgi:hypothetical protein